MVFLPPYNTAVRRYPIDMDGLIVRLAQPQDARDIAEMFHSLWPDSTVEEHSSEVTSSLTVRDRGPLPSAILVAVDAKGRLFGFVEVDLRSHADGCDPKRPVAFIEGWYVAPALRRRRIGAQLIAAAEDWGRSQGCIEMASDTWLDNVDSQSAHQALGFEIVDRCVHYRKDL